MSVISGNGFKKKVEGIIVDVVGDVNYCRLLRWWYSFTGRKEWISDRWVYPYKVQGGGVEKEKYYVFRWDYAMIGIFDAAREFMLAAQWAERKGFIPLISLAEEEIYREGKLGEGNFWEITFLQYGGLSLKEVLNSKECDLTVSIMSPHKRIRNGLQDITVTDVDWKNYYKSFYALYSKFCVMRPELKEIYQERKNKLFKGKERVLGVCIREGFGIADEVPQSAFLRRNPHEPDIEEVISQTENSLVEYNCEYIYLACQFKESIDKFKERFHEKVLYYERETPSIYTFIKEYQRKGDAFKYHDSIYESTAEKIQEDYVGQIYCLAGCTSVLGTYSGGMRAALLINGGEYEYVKIFEDKGWGEEAPKV